MLPGLRERGSSEVAESFEAVEWLAGPSETQEIYI